MVFFMVFIACSKAADSDTMRVELMQSWYFVAPFSCEFLIEDGVIAGYNRATYIL